jgi:competence protein ComEC
MPNPFLPVINRLLPEPHASLLNGILFGVKASMPTEFYQALITAGVLHIIALSGMNISILVNLLARMILRLGRKRSILLTMASIWGFVWFVGFSPSIVRAAGMGCVSLLAVYLGRQHYGLLSLILISMIMLLFDWNLLKSISFQLSFLATLGIILAGGKTQCQNTDGVKQSLVSAVHENLRLTLSAQLFTLPVILFNFRRLSLIAPLANILTEWIMQPVMVLGFVTAISGLIWRPLGIIPAWVVWVPLTYFITVVQWLAKIPFASVQF